ncbi:MAG: putative sulfate exporter family transporter [Chitinophagales bacterium]|nr:putative sulfate exporter family transporter [Hyphomicrobiales bacterium]
MLTPKRERRAVLDRAHGAARSLFPGLAVSFIIAAAAAHLSEHYGGPVMLFAVLLGMALGFLGENKLCEPGIQAASKQVLRIGVALLGFRIAIGDVLALGLPAVAVVIVAVALTILAAVAAARLFGQSLTFGVLMGGSTAICGASAALAISAAIPRHRQKASDVSFTIIAVTTLSTTAMIVYPLLAASLGFSGKEAGFFIGATIHDVAQVIGAGYAISDEAGDTATIVKLLRVGLLLPVLLLVSVVYSRRLSGQSAPLPIFAFAFAGFVCIHSAGIVPEAIETALNAASRWCLIAAIAAVGMTTSLQALAKLGWRPVVVVLASSAALVMVVAGGLWMMRAY